MSDYTIDLETGCRVWQRARSLDQSTGCWVWQRSTSLNQLYVGPIPDGYQIDHICANERCVNPAHLAAVTALENVHRARRSRHAN